MIEGEKTVVAGAEMIVAGEKRADAGAMALDCLGENPQSASEGMTRGEARLQVRAMIKLITGYSAYSANQLAQLGAEVAENLPGLSVFSTLKPTPAEIEAEVTALRDAIGMEGKGRAQAIAAAFQALEQSLGEIAVNAPQVAGVTDTQLAEIGLPVAKTPQRATQPPEAPQNLVLEHGTSQGEITGKCKSMGENVRVYEAQWTLDPNGNAWSETFVFTNARSFKFTGLTRGKDVWVRARARNSVGAGAWSDPATIMVT